LRSSRSLKSIRHPRKVRAVAPLMAQHRVDPRQQLARIERLGQVVVRSHFQSENAIDVLAARGEHDDRYLRFRAHLAAQAEAVFTRQHHVEDEQIDAMVGHRPDHFAPVDRHRDVAAVAAQVFRDQRPRLAVVVNDENVRRCRSHAVSCP
jgi:hypothetical protein